MLRVRFSVWREHLPLDALPQEGSIEVRVVPESELSAVPYAKPERGVTSGGSHLDKDQEVEVGMRQGEP